jgi:hypothetical protein
MAGVEASMEGSRGELTGEGRHGWGAAWGGGGGTMGAVGEGARCGLLFTFCCCPGCLLRSVREEEETAGRGREEREEKEEEKEKKKKKLEKICKHRNF